MAQRSPFGEWLAQAMAARRWDQRVTGEAVGVFKGTVGRWLLPIDHPNHRVPTFENISHVAEAFGIERDFLLRLTGLDPDAGDASLTPVKQNAMAIIRTLPDEVVDYLYPQLIALTHFGVATRTPDPVDWAAAEPPAPASAK